MYILYLLFAVFSAHFLAAFLHYHTILRDFVTREKLESILIIIGLFLVVLKYKIFV